MSKCISDARFHGSVIPKFLAPTPAGAGVARPGTPVLLLAMTAPPPEGRDAVGSGGSSSTATQARVPSCLKGLKNYNACDGHTEKDYC